MLDLALPPVTRHDPGNDVHTCDLARIEERVADFLMAADDRAAVDCVSCC